MSQIGGKSRKVMVCGRSWLDVNSQASGEVICLLKGHVQVEKP